MRKIAHPTGPALERVELLVPDEWIDSVGKNVLTLERRGGVGLLNLSLESHLYQPGMMPPHLLEMAERMASAINSEIFGQAVWRRIPEGYEDAPIDRTGARSTYDLVVGTAGACNREEFVQCFYVLQRTSLVFATYICENSNRPGDLAEAEKILKTIEIKQVPHVSSA
jgi:hypothetical protein